MRGNISWRAVLVFSLALAVLGLAAGQAPAADLTWDTVPGVVGGGDGSITGGAGTWDTTTGNWTSDGGANNVAWDNTANANDTAVFTGTAGVVDLGADITLNGMRIDTGYTIGTSSNETNILNFVGTTPQITFTVANTYIYAGITGSPNLNVGLPDKSSSYLVPNVQNMTLGHVTYYTKYGSRLHLAGTTSGNSIASFNSTVSYATIYVDGSGTWTLGNIGGTGQVELYQTSGNLIANGTIDISTYFQIKGGVFHYNNAAAVAASKRLTMMGGDLDNSSGVAIVSTNNHAMYWSGDFTFIGSKGVLSNLDLGAGAVTMNATRQVTIQNADTTLTVGGVISGATFGLTKAGLGTLALSGANAYTGPTTVNAGTLLARNATALGAGSAANVTVATNAALNYYAAADSPLTIGGNLAVAGGAGTAIGVSVGSTATSAAINVTGDATITDGQHTVNIVGVNGVAHATGPVTLIHGGGAGSSLAPATAPTLGIVYNNTDFTINPTAGDGGTQPFTRTATDLQITTVSATPLTSAV